MSTPIGHSLLGLAFFNGLKPRYCRWWIVAFIVAANFPDLDFLPGWFIGQPNAFHHGPSHSLAAVILVGLLCAMIFAWMQHGNFWLHLLVFGSVGLSHLVLDYFTLDTAPPFGAPLFWPISEQYFIAPVPLFSDVYRGGTSDTFFSDLLVAHNGRTIAREILLLAPVAVLAHFLPNKLKLKFEWQKNDAGNKKN